MKFLFPTKQLEESRRERAWKPSDMQQVEFPTKRLSPRLMPHNAPLFSALPTTGIG